MGSQNKSNISSVALFAKLLSSKTFNTLSTTSKKQSNSLQVNLSSKLANNSKLTSNKYKKYLENNLCLYCSTKDYKPDSCLKKQNIVTTKGCNASVSTNTFTTASKKPLKNRK